LAATVAIQQAPKKSEARKTHSLLPARTLSLRGKYLKVPWIFEFLLIQDGKQQWF